MAARGEVNPDKLNEFIGKFVGDLGAAMHGSTIVLGEKLGLYKALDVDGGLTAAELGKKTGTNSRFVQEWLSSQAASGYVSWDAKSGKFYLTPEQAFALTHEDSPAYFPGAFLIASANYLDEARIIEAFKTGKGVGWHERHGNLFQGTAKFFRPNYVGNLLSAWLPALDGVVAKLEKGGKVADVGCGLGSSSFLMAKAFPKATVHGFDYHKGSIDMAKEIANKTKGVPLPQFDVAMAQDFPGTGYDLVTCFDCLHDMTDPVGAAKHVRKAIAKDGTWMVVEPFANETLQENLTPVGRVFYSASTMICTPAGLSEPGGAALGAQATEKRLQEIAKEAGFTRFRRAVQTPFNRVLEIRP